MYQLKIHVFMLYHVLKFQVGWINTILAINDTNFQFAK